MAKINIKKLEEYTKNKEFQDTLKLLERIRKKVKKKLPNKTYKEIEKAMKIVPDYNPKDEAEAVKIATKILKGDLK